MPRHQPPRPPGRRSHRNVSIGSRGSESLIVDAGSGRATGGSGGLTRTEACEERLAGAGCGGRYSGLLLPCPPTSTYRFINSLSKVAPPLPSLSRPLPRPRHIPWPAVSLPLPSWPSVCLLFAYSGRLSGNPGRPAKAEEATNRQRKQRLWFLWPSPAVLVSYPPPPSAGCTELPCVHACMHAERDRR